MSKNDPLGEVKLQLGAVDLSRTFSEVRTLTSYTGKVRKEKIVRDGSKKVGNKWKFFL